MLFRKIRLSIISSPKSSSSRSLCLARLVTFLCLPDLVQWFPCMSAFRELSALIRMPPQTRRRQEQSQGNPSVLQGPLGMLVASSCRPRAPLSLTGLAASPAAGAAQFVTHCWGFPQPLVSLFTLSGRVAVEIYASRISLF